jgi:hypothetical protein
MNKRREFVHFVRRLLILIKPDQFPFNLMWWVALASFMALPNGLTQILTYTNINYSHISINNKLSTFSLPGYQYYMYGLVYELNLDDRWLLLIGFYSRWTSFMTRFNSRTQRTSQIEKRSMSKRTKWIQWRFNCYLNNRSTTNERRFYNWCKFNFLFPFHLECISLI